MAFGFTILRFALMLMTFLANFDLNYVLAGSIKEQMCDLSVKELKRNAENAYMKKNYQDANEIYSLMVEKEPKEQKHYYKRSQTFEKLKKYRKALVDLNKVVEIDPKSVKGINMRGRIYMTMGWCNEAYEDYIAVLKLKPTHGDAKKKKPKAKECLLQMREVKRARAKEDYRLMEKTLDGLINDVGKALHFLFLRAESRLLQEKYYEAIADLGSLLKEAPGEVEPLYMRAVAYYYLTEYDAVKRHIKEIMKYDPDHKEARSLNKKISLFQKLVKKGRKEVKAGNMEQAVESFLEAVDIDTDHLVQVLSVYTEVCEVQIESRNPEAAAEFCEAAISEDHEKQLEICLKYASFHLNHCDDDASFEFNMQLWNKCQQAAGDQMTREIRDGMQKSQMMHKRFKQKDRDYYGILGVPKDAKIPEIRKKYRKLAKELHPDRFVGASEEEKKIAEKKFHRVAQAYEVLSDQEVRSRYDRGEDVEDPNGQQQQQRGFHGFPFRFKQGGQSYSFNF